VTREIEAIFFDVGDTLRARLPDHALQAQASEDLYALIQPHQPPGIFFERIDQRYANYQEWRGQSMIEITEKELWTQWMLPEIPSERITPLVDRLMNLFRLRSGRLTWLEGAEDVISELHARGYILGIISNTISSCETPQGLAEAGLTPLFSAIVLSTTFGKRKPDPDIFTHAARLANVSPDLCAYVGDRPSRDVVGSRRAGFAKCVIIANSNYPSEAGIPGGDATIRVLRELLDIFPEKKQ
jgi:putative hydrolase of the HAD superfamily